MLSIFLDVFLAAFLVGVSVPGIVLAVRALPPVDRRVLAGQKPWACDVCMCFWATGLVATGLAWAFWNATLLLACGPAYTLAMIVLGWMTRAPENFPEPPPEGTP